MTEHAVKSTHLQAGLFVKVCSCGLKLKAGIEAKAHDLWLEHCEQQHLAASYREDDPQLDLKAEP